MIYTNTSSMDIRAMPKDNHYEVILQSLGASRNTFDDDNEPLLAIVPKTLPRDAYFNQWYMANILASSFTLTAALFINGPDKRSTNFHCDIRVRGKFGQSVNDTNVVLIKSSGGFIAGTVRNNRVDGQHFTFKPSSKNGRIVKLEPSIKDFFSQEVLDCIVVDLQSIIDKVVEIRYLPSVVKFLDNIKELRKEKEYVTKTYDKPVLDLDDLAVLEKFDSTTSLMMAIHLSSRGDRKIVRVKSGLGPTFFLVPEDELEDFDYTISRISQDKMAKKLSRSADRLSS